MQIIVTNRTNPIKALFTVIWFRIVSWHSVTFKVAIPEDLQITTRITWQMNIVYLPRGYTSLQRHKTSNVSFLSIEKRTLLLGRNFGDLKAMADTLDTGEH